ncbi:MAG: exodeoxyribonuclease VII large subunit [Peptoniphilaceae bacterium]|nr:exodeoxyribonuclease VII large subunit [Peptoniphilaceae bacterium]MDY6086019.1 exodeoxyribonuclease VII large subunit [Peptoniphilaceae bacterium]
MNPIGVSTLVGYLEKVVLGDPLFQRLTIEGELSGISRRGRYAYFSLKDEKASVSCVDFSGVLTPNFRDGDQVLLMARAVVYKPQGRFQLRAMAIRPAGRGAQLEALEALKRKLFAEGLFDPKKKRLLPDFPRGIGLVTSPEGAVIHDFGNEMASRYRLAPIIVSPARVQGMEAPRQMIAAISALEAMSLERPIDVIVLARGGGSSDDLSAFNDEALVRKIASCTLPVVTAIGHQVDTTLSDLAADVRASTPTEAAYFVAPDAAELHQQIIQTTDRAQHAMQRALESRRTKLERLRLELERQAPLRRIGEKKAHLLQAETALQKAFRSRLEALSRAVDREMKRLTEVRERMLSDASWRVTDPNGRPLRAGALSVGEHYVLRAGRYRYDIGVMTKEMTDGSDGDL